MQSVEEKGFCFTALDGGLADLSIATAGLTGAADAGVENDLGLALERILRASGAGIRVRHDLPDAPQACLSAPAPTDITVAPHTATRIRSFDPLVASRLRALDVAVVTGQASAESREKVSELVQTAQVGPGDAGAATLDAACVYAMRFGRRRVQLLTDQADPDESLAALDDVAERYPELELQSLPAREALSSLVAGTSDLDVVVASPLMSELLTATASILSGVPALITVVDCAGEQVVVAPCRESSTLDPVAAAAGAESPSAYVLCLVDLLVMLGRDEAARRIMNGWCRTLEYGCHTREFEMTRPYARCLDVDELASSITGCLDEQARVLLPRNCGAERQPVARTRRTPLRLVHSR